MKIAFISPYEELSELVASVADEMGVEINIRTGSFEEGARIAKELEEDQYEIIISRGATYNNISELIHIPVVNCDFSEIDILYSIYEAKGNFKKIGLIVNNHIPINEKLICEMFNIELIYHYNYKNLEESKKMIHQVRDQGAEVIIGGIVTKNYVESIGLEGILLKTSAETVRQSIRNAMEVIGLARRQMLQAERLNQILNFSYEGIIVVDTDGIVTFFNPAAENIMGINAADIIGNRADRYIPTTGLINIIESGEPEIGTVQKLKNTTIVANRIPIKVNNVVQGAVSTFQDISKIQDFEIRIRSEIYKKGLQARYYLRDYIAINKKVIAMLDRARVYAASDSTILIHGESGTGKEILAQGIHNASHRKDYPFVALNCSAIPEHLLESELFGYDEGAFTGAKKGGKMGIFELAHKGTIFLDEIGSMPLSLQSSLLRVLQEREVWRVGSNKVIKVDIRVIAATNNDLFLAVEKGEFRRDLYYRLNVLKLTTLPLRERKEDIEEIFEHFLKGHNLENLNITKGFKDNISDYYWPGNVRELENFTERVILLHQHLSLELLFQDFITEVQEEMSVGCKKTVSDDPDTLRIQKGSLNEMENEILNQLYKEFGNNATLLAEYLKVSRTTLWKKLKKERTS